MIDRAFERQMQVQSVQMARVVGMRARGMDPECHGCSVEYESPKWTARHTCAIGEELRLRLAKEAEKRANKKHRPTHAPSTKRKTCP